MSLPRPIDTAEEYLAAIHGRLSETNELLRDYLEELKAQRAEQTPEQPSEGHVELREPVQPRSNRKRREG